MPSPCAQATGIAVNDECISLFNDFKLQKGDGQLRYITFKIEGDSEIVIDAKGAREKTYEDFSAEVQAADGPRYGVIDVDFTTADGRSNSKIVFISWVPDTAKIKQKMVYSGSKDALKRVLLGIMVIANIPHVRRRKDLVRAALRCVCFRALSRRQRKLPSILLLHELKEDQVKCPSAITGTWP